MSIMCIKITCLFSGQEKFFSWNECKDVTRYLHWKRAIIDSYNIVFMSHQNGNLTPLPFEFDGNLAPLCRKRRIKVESSLSPRNNDIFNFLDILGHWNIQNSTEFSYPTQKCHIICDRNEYSTAFVVVKLKAPIFLIKFCPQ